MSDPIKLLQITDCHLGDQHGDELLSMSPDESLQDVLELVSCQHQDNDLVVITGDLVNDASRSAYERLYDTLSQHISSPFSWLPGNHDNPVTMQEFGDEVNAKLHVFDQWVVILLNTHVTGRVHGALSSKELEFLGQSLAEHADKYAVICLHHHPVPVGSEWIDYQSVDNAHSFWQVVDKFPRVKVILWGHVHQQFEMDHNGIALRSSPSTCIQFKPGKKEFGVENKMPGYRWLELHDDGSFASGIERVAEKDYGTNLSSDGY